MPRLIMTYVGKHNGVDCYSPLDAEDVKAINGQNTIVCDVKGNRSKRTTLQNRALHMFFTMLGDALNAAGWDMKRTLTKQVEIPWMPGTVKEFLWRPIQSAMLDKDSTTELETNEVSMVYETLNRHTASKLGVSVSFPDKYRQMLEQDYNEST